MSTSIVDEIDLSQSFHYTSSTFYKTTNKKAHKSEDSNVFRTPLYTSKSLIAFVFTEPLTLRRDVLKTRQTLQILDLEGNLVDDLDEVTSLEVGYG